MVEHQKNQTFSICDIINIRIIQSLMNHLRQLGPQTNNIVGIELLNEPNPPSDGVLQNWYTSAITALRSQDPTIPIYIGEPNHTLITSPTIIHRHHLLFLTITSIVVSLLRTSTSQYTHALHDDSASIPRMLASVLEKLGRAGGGITVGEWSGALNPGSLPQPGAEFEGRKEFVNAQWRYLTSIAVDGSFGPIRRNTEEIQVGAGKMQLREVYSLHRWVSSTDGWKQTIS